MSGLRARTGLRTLLGLLAALGLTAALTMPVLADHDPADGPAVTPTSEGFPGGEPSCSVGVGIRFGGAEDDGVLAEDAEVVINSGGVTATVKILSLDNDELAFEVTGGLAAVVKVKGGQATEDDQNVYNYSALTGGGIAHDDGLITPNEQGISHVDFCVVEATVATATPTPTPTPTASPTPTPTGQVAGGTPTPAPTRGAVLGGNPTPSAGALPNTAMGDFAQVPATALSLVLLGALAAMLYVRLSRQR